MPPPRDPLHQALGPLACDTGIWPGDIQYLQLETAEAHLDDSSDLEPVRHAVRQALTMTQNNLEEARRSVLDPRAAPLEGRSLTEALSHLVDTISDDGALEMAFESVGGAQPLPARIEAGIYRIARENLTNASDIPGRANVLEGV